MNKKLKKQVDKDVLKIIQYLINHDVPLKEQIEYFQEIYTKYGKDAYAECVPSKIHNMKIRSLLKEKRYIDLDLQFEVDDVYKNLSKSMYDDVYFETNNRKLSILHSLKGAFIYWSRKFKIVFSKAFLPAVLATGALIPTLTSAMSDYLKYKNEKEEQQQITEYMENINNYASQISKYNLSDLENIMKVMYDTWTNIEGYGTPEQDLMGYLGLDLNESGIGVCRTLADDFVKRINAINPSYNAQCVTVDLKNAEHPNYEFVTANITTTSTATETYDDTYRTPNSPVSTYPFISLLPNHVIVFMNIPNTETILVVDPTSPSIGVYLNGEIKMFNDLNGISSTYTRSLPGDLFINGFKGWDYGKEYIDSFSYSNENIYAELNEIFGLEAQNIAIDKVKDLPIIWYSSVDSAKPLEIPEDEIFMSEYYSSNSSSNNSRSSKYNSFRDSLKVDVNCCSVNKDLIHNNLQNTPKTNKLKNNPKQIQLTETQNSDFLEL